MKWWRTQCCLYFFFYPMCTLACSFWKQLSKQLPMLYLLKYYQHEKGFRHNSIIEKWLGWENWKCFLCCTITHAGQTWMSRMQQCLWMVMVQIPGPLHIFPLRLQLLAFNLSAFSCDHVEIQLIIKVPVMLMICINVWMMNSDDLCIHFEKYQLLTWFKMLLPWSTMRTLAFVDFSGF